MNNKKRYHKKKLYIEHNLIILDKDNKKIIK